MAVGDEEASWLYIHMYVHIIVCYLFVVVLYFALFLRKKKVR